MLQQNLISGIKLLCAHTKIYSVLNSVVKKCKGFSLLQKEIHKNIYYIFVYLTLLKNLIINVNTIILLKKLNITYAVKIFCLLYWEKLSSRMQIKNVYFTKAICMYYKFSI